MDGPKREASTNIAGSLSPGFPAHRVACDHGWLPHTRGSSAGGYHHRPARRAHRLPPRRRPGRARTAGVRRRPVRLRPAAPVSPPDPDSGGWRPAGQSDAFGDWFTTTSVPPRRGPPRVRRPRRDRFGWLLSPWLLAPTATVAVATTGVALWLWQTAPTGTAQARPGAAVTTTVPAATGGLPGGRAGHCVSSRRPAKRRRRLLPASPRLPVAATRLAVHLPPRALPRRNPGPLRRAPQLMHPSRHHCQRPRLLSRLPLPRRNLARPPRTRRRPPSTAPRPRACHHPPRACHHPPRACHHPPRACHHPPEPVTTPPEPVTTPPEPVTTPPEPVTTPPPPPVSSPATQPPH